MFQDVPRRVLFFSRGELHNIIGAIIKNPEQCRVFLNSSEIVFGSRRDMNTQKIRANWREVFFLAAIKNRHSSTQFIFFPPSLEIWVKPNNYRTEKKKIKNLWKKRLCVSISRRKAEEKRTNDKFPPALKRRWSTIDKRSERGERTAEEPAENEGGKKLLNLHNLLAAASPLLSLQLFPHTSSIVDDVTRPSFNTQSQPHSNGHFFRLRFALFDRSLAAACLLAFFRAQHSTSPPELSRV